MLKVGAITCRAFASTAYFIDHHETLPRILEILSSVSLAELEPIKDNF